MSPSALMISLARFLPIRAHREFEQTWLGSLLGQAVIMMILILAYVAALAIFYKVIPDALNDLRSVVGDAFFYAFAVAPFFVILGFSIVPTTLRARRQSRLKRRKFAFRAGASELFRLYPYGTDQHSEFERPGGEDKRAVNWLKATAHSVNYLCGVSGVGKSSLVQASLLPGMEAAGWRSAVVRVDTDPVERIRQAVLSVSEFVDVAERETLPLMELLNTVSRQIERTGQSPLLIVVDQFEEFLILNDAVDQQLLADILRGLIDSPLNGIRFLFVFRSDYREVLFKLSLPASFLGTTHSSWRPSIATKRRTF